MKLLRLLAVLFLLALLAGGAALYLVNQPYRGFQEERYLDFPKGTSTRTMAKILEREGVVQHDWLFLLARAVSPGKVLQAGEYKFEKSASPLDVFRRIAGGDIFYLELVVPEGQNMFDIAADAKRLGIFSEERFLKAAKNVALIRDLDPKAVSLEGYLWPDTYRVLRTTTPAQLCQTMTGRFREKWKALHTTADVHRTVTLASLVEREARVPQDRPLVSSVFQNRLKAGMKLDCDPTTIYAALLDGHYRGKIYRSDLASPSEYNTYQHAGLPPGPIANPGLTSLKAALAPTESRYLFFVVKPDGSGAHTFSETLAQHATATLAYRRGQK